jgi:hypothetical protein
MFTYRRNGDLIYPVLGLHWAALLPPNILLGIGSPLVVITVFFSSEPSVHEGSPDRRIFWP